MYNYHNLKTHQEIINDVSYFCAKDHTRLEVIKHCLKTCDDLFMLHRCTLLHKPQKLDGNVWNFILYKYTNYLMERIEDMSFPTTIPVGEVYERVIPRSLKNNKYNKYDDNKDDGSKSNNNNYYSRYYKDKRILYFIPMFFGLKYKPSSNSHKILYDIVYRIYHPDHVLVPYCIKKENIKWCELRSRYVSPNHPLLKERNSNKNQLIYIISSRDEINDLEYNTREVNTDFKHLTQPSLFRFESSLNSNYSDIFNQIRTGLIENFLVKFPASHIKLTMQLELHSSQMMSLVFSLIEQLLKPKYEKYFPFKMSVDSKEEIDSNYHKQVYAYIIDRCKNFQSHTISEYGKSDMQYIPINMDIKDEKAILYYAYTFFINLKTLDYLTEMIDFFNISSNDSKKSKYIKKLDETIKIKDGYKLAKRFVISDIKLADKSKSNNHYTDGDFVHYDKLSSFIEYYKEDIMEFICAYNFTIKSAEYNLFYKKDKLYNYMLDFIHLYRTISQQSDCEKISIQNVIDIMYLYVRLKVSKIEIPTMTSRYTGTNQPKPVKIDSVLKLIRSIHDSSDDISNVSNETKMRIIVIETWLSAVLYVMLNDMSIELFLIRMEAIKNLFFASIQKIPAITEEGLNTQDIDRLLTELLFPQ